MKNCSARSGDRRKFFHLSSFGPKRAMASTFLRFLEHIKRGITVGRTPLDEWSATLHDNTHTSKPTTGFEPTISAWGRPQTYTFDRAATGAGLPKESNF